MKKTTIILSTLLFVLSACGGNGNRNEPNPSDANASEKMQKSTKRGVGFEFSLIEDLPLLTDAISWDYNWGNTCNETAAMWFDANDVDYVPMCWNNNYSKDKIRQFVKSHPNTKYILGYNEPNLVDQANMTPAQAAERWREVVDLAKELHLQLGAPAMNYGTLPGYSDPIKWTDEFLKQPGVSLDDIDFFTVHCYMTSASAVANFIEMFRKYGKPVWLTEFCAWDPVPSSMDVQLTYMSNVLNYLEQEPLVERYAWFMPRMKESINSKPFNQLLTHPTASTPSQLTALGKVYTMFSSFDKETALYAAEYVFAHQYIATSVNNIQVLPSKDEEKMTAIGREGLQVSALQEGIKLTYLVNTGKTKTLTLRHSGYSNSGVIVEVDGKELTTFDVPRTGDAAKFVDEEAPLSLSAGNHTIAFTVRNGSFNFSGFSIK